MGQATYRATGTPAAGTAASSILVSTPALTAVGDLVVAFVSKSDGQFYTAPDGWNFGPAITGAVSNARTISTFWKWATAVGVESGTWSWATGSNVAAVIVAVSGVLNRGYPVAVSAFSATTLTVPSMTTTRGLGLLLTAYATNSGASFTPPAGMTEVADFVAGTTTFGLNILTVGAGATGAKGATSAASVEPSSFGLIVAEDNVPPNAPNLTSPANSSTIDRNVAQRFGVVFSDPDVGDSQSALSIRYRLGAGAWTTVSATTPNPFYDFPAATFLAGAYEWQAQTTDSQGLQGPLSASRFFTAADTPGVPSITAPISGSTVPAYANVAWSVAAQTNFELRRVADLAGAPDTATVYYTTGDLASAGTRAMSVSFSTNNRWEHVQVRVKAAGLWSSWASIRVFVSYTAPMVPTLTVAASSATASIAVAITNPAPTGGEPVASYNDVFVSSPLDVEYRAASMVAPNSTWIWWTPAAARAYTIRVESVGSNGTRASSAPGAAVVLDGGGMSVAPDLTLDGGSL